MENQKINAHEEALKIITSDRKRTNILNKYEQDSLAWLVQRMPSWVSSNILTSIGFAGNIITFMAFVLAANIHIYYLLFGVLGFAVSWFGDSLDGRLAYYRNIPRKNYGFALDITVDWLGIILLGLGFVLYMQPPFQLIGFGFVAFYGWQMLLALIRYAVTGKYTIDSGLLGPTEVRIIISFILIIEVVFVGSILYFSALATFILLISSILETKKVLKLSDEADKRKKNK